MGFGSKTNAPKDGLKILVIALATVKSRSLAFRAANRRLQWNLRDQNGPRDPRKRRFAAPIAVQREIIAK